MSTQYTNSNRELLPTEQFMQLDFNLQLESGLELKQPTIAFQTWGKLNADKSNVIWVCHALTGNHLIHEWWSGLFGQDKCFDPADYFIVSVNVPGSCYGTTGPLSFKNSNDRFFRSFPAITIRDMVSVLDFVRVYLEIDSIHILIGASLGGQQVLEWAIQQPHLFQYLIPIATNVKHSPFGIAFNEAQRLALLADPTFEQDLFNGGKKGLIAARSIAMLSYRTYNGYQLTQAETTADKSDDFKAASYQRYQGEKLTNRFNAYSYWVLSKSMDSHNLERNRKPVEDLLAALTTPTLVVGIDSDLLFPLREQQFIADQIPNARLATLTSDFGHDGFLVEFEQLTTEIQSFLDQQADKKTTQVIHN